jgi:hypothetical protein
MITVGLLTHSPLTTRKVQVSVTLVDDNACLALDERSNSDCCLAVTKVNKRDIARVLIRQVCLSKETIVECNGGALINESDALQSSDFSGIKDSLSFYIAEVGWH